MPLAKSCYRKAKHSLACAIVSTVAYSCLSLSFSGVYQEAYADTPEQLVANEIEAMTNSSKSLRQDSIDFKNFIEKIDAFCSCFTQNVYDKNGEVISDSRGNVKLSRPYNFLMETKLPDRFVLYTKDQSFYYYDEAVNQLSIYPMDRFKNNPFRLLTDLDDKLLSEYLISRSDNRFTLIPNTPMEVNSITIAFSDTPMKNHKGKEQYAIESISIRMEDGNTNFYRFYNTHTDVDLKGFNFKLPYDVSISDER